VIKNKNDGQELKFLTSSPSADCWNGVFPTSIACFDINDRNGDGIRKGQRVMERLVVMQRARNCNKMIEMTDEILHCAPPPPRPTVARVVTPSPLPVLIETIEWRRNLERARRNGKVSCDAMG